MIKYIHIKTSCNVTLKTYTYYLQKIFNQLQINVSIFYLPMTSKKITLLKSPHVFKKAKEQFELREYKAVIKIKENNLERLESVKLALFNRPKSIQLKIKS